MGHKRFMRGLKVGAIVAAFLSAITLTTLLPAVTYATVIGTCDADAPGTCTKSVTLSGNTLTMVLTNTSPVANGGFITADAFDLAGAISITAFNSTNANFSLVPSPLPSTGGSFNVAPDGVRDFVVTLEPASPQPYEGAGSPTGGIPVGGSATFTFTLGSTAGLSESTIMGTELVRFRGFNDGGSDKDRVTPGTPPLPGIPEPASMLLLGSGLAGLALLNRKRKATKN